MDFYTYTKNNGLLRMNNIKAVSLHEAHLPWHLSYMSELLVYLSNNLSAKPNVCKGDNVWGPMLANHLWETQTARELWK